MKNAFDKLAKGMSNFSKGLYGIPIYKKKRIRKRKRGE